MSDDPEVAAEAGSEDLDLQITNFIAVRDELAAIDKKWEAERAEMAGYKNRLEGRIQAILESHNQESARTKSGTAYFTRKWSAPLADPQAFMDYVVNSGEFDLLERRANVTAVKQYVEDHQGQLPAGCSLSSYKSVRVKR